MQVQRARTRRLQIQEAAFFERPADFCKRALFLRHVFDDVREKRTVERFVCEWEAVALDVARVALEARPDARPVDRRRPVDGFVLESFQTVDRYVGAAAGEISIDALKVAAPDIQHGGALRQSRRELCQRLQWSDG